MTNDALTLAMSQQEKRSLYAKKRRSSDSVLKVLINLSAFITVFVLAGIILFILVNGVSYISWKFISTPYSVSDPNMTGILPMIINTLYIVVLTLLISAPIGICSALYLTQYAKQGRLVKTIRFTTEILAGIPSIIFGLFGYTFFIVLFHMGTSSNILAGCLTMTICILPTIIRTTEESLLAVPSSYKEGAMALGAGKLRVIMGIVLPCAMPGVLTAVILAMGRIVGESAALLWTSGTGYDMPKDFLGHIMESGRTLTLHLYLNAKERPTQDALSIAFATATVLLVFIFLLNRLAGMFSKMLRKG